MPQCEDYPCCGHEPGDCPDSKGRFSCVGCGKPLPKDATSSFCNRKACVRRQQRRYDDLDHDYSMNY